MSYAVIKTGGKQFAVEEGQTLRGPTISGDAGAQVDVQALVLGGGNDANPFGSDSTMFVYGTLTGKIITRLAPRSLASAMARATAFLCPAITTCPGEL